MGTAYAVPCFFPPSAHNKVDKRPAVVLVVFVGKGTCKTGQN